VPGLGITYGRGGATTNLQDLQNADCIIIEGSNMAEAHPVGFRHPMIAKRKGAKLIHVDPRFTRTSAMCDIYAPIRPGTDIAFLGGLINYVLQNEEYFEEYVKVYTNAATIIAEDFEEADASGLFSGWNEDSKLYDPTSWRYEGHPIDYASVGGSQGRIVGEAGEGEGGEMHPGMPRPTDMSLEHPRCVFQILKRHFARYTPEMVEKVCGTPKEAFLEVARTLAENSGREKTSALCYAVGWTQHSKGVQIIRTAAILQLLLGNIGRPGGGIMALRGHATIQGSTDIATLYDILPGYLPMPDANKDHDTWKSYLENETARSGWWSNFPKYIISQMKAWYGEKFDPESGDLFDNFPRISGDHSYYPTIMDMKDGKVKGCFVFGQNFAVGGPHVKMARDGLRNLDWVVVLDAYGVETAEAWKLDGVKPEECGAEVFFIPCALVAEKDGSFTQTQRLLQWHDKAVEPPGDARSDAWFVYHLGRRIKELYKGSRKRRDALVRALTWDYPTEGERGEPHIESILKEVSGYTVADGEPMGGFAELQDDGSTACGSWIYSGVYAGGVNQARGREPGDNPNLEWAWAWPMNRRVIYNRASADPEGRPWSERKRYVWWDESRERWTGEDVPDFSPDKRPDYVPPEGAQAEEALRGDQPFIMQGDGRAWLYAPSGLVDGPFPTHYEPQESPVRNPLYAQQSNPVRQQYKRPDNPYNPTDGDAGAEVFPYVMTTYRLTEHHTAGGMTRGLPYLAELQPEFFCEVSPELAAERGLENGGWATIVSSRSAIEARVLVTERVAPLRVGSDPPRVVHQVGLPYHWGHRGYTTGDSANDLFPLALDTNVHIQEVKAATCDIRPGRRPRGRALLELVEGYRRRAGIDGGDAGGG
jgi:formate dehydrogenase major subunit